MFLTLNIVKFLSHLSTEENFHSYCFEVKDKAPWQRLILLPWATSEPRETVRNINAGKFAGEGHAALCLHVSHLEGIEDLKKNILLRESRNTGEASRHWQQEVDVGFVWQRKVNESKIRFPVRRHGCEETRSPAAASLSGAWGRQRARRGRSCGKLIRYIIKDQVKGKENKNPQTWRNRVCYILLGNWCTSES